MNLRPARADDAPQIAALLSAVWIGTYATEGVTPAIAAYVQEEFTPERVASDLRHPGRHTWIAEEGAGVIGYADLQLDRAWFESGRQGEVLHLYVNERHRARGVGSRLLQTCSDFAFGLGCDAVWLSVWEKNNPALDFYENRGWDYCGFRTFRLGGVDHANRVYALRRGGAAKA